MTAIITLTTRIFVRMCLHHFVQVLVLVSSDDQLYIYISLVSTSTTNQSLLIKLMRFPQHAQSISSE